MTEYIIFSFRKNGEFNISMNENLKRSDSSEVDRLRHLNRMEDDEESQYMDSLSVTTDIEIEEDIEEEYEHYGKMTFEEISSSNGNKRSLFAFPVLASLWIGSPVKMLESAKHLRKERFWKLGFNLCCKF
ncbi:hypothetical protein Sjap_015270 [Stephania japonica]|uniref:Uncharacterized protein n=1 Tax=Stephania japonica TaxID=461633 RepID=A0AAP0IIX8_9MAGN